MITKEAGRWGCADIGDGRWGCAGVGWGMGCAGVGDGMCYELVRFLSI